ncbi:MAG TPA: transcription termination/antitermination NusG family protein [Verrucomicrobiae bacterium]|nr:transcription termination/antitermination NusG family protein [Verrucomicrobiae bacterium]
MDHLALAQQTARAWYCVHTHCLREHIAAGWLQARLQVETYLPRIRFRRKERHRLAWTTEALFPTYLFARFDLATVLQQVQCVPGVIDLVRFGRHCPTVPDHAIEALRARVGADEVHVIREEYIPGQGVEIITGPFQGLQAVVTRVLPAKERVNVLLDFLGRQTNVEVATNNLSANGDIRRRLFQ